MKVEIELVDLNDLIRRLDAVEKSLLSEGGFWWCNKHDCMSAFSSFGGTTCGCEDGTNFEPMGKPVKIEDLT